MSPVGPGPRGRRGGRGNHDPSSRTQWASPAGGLATLPTPANPLPRGSTTATPGTVGGPKPRKSSNATRFPLCNLLTLRT